MNENFHSWHGAYTESLYVFIAQGLEICLQKFTQINLLEIGLGTGLNAILTWQHHHLKGNYTLQYTGTEKFPLDKEWVEKLNYPAMWEHDETSTKAFYKLHDAPWDTLVVFNEGFSLIKKTGEAQTTTTETNHYHLIYFDAFAPEKQPDMWTTEFFSTLYQAMVKGGILVTYCAKGQFKRDLKAAGFVVETLPGPPGKREMVRAVKPE